MNQMKLVNIRLLTDRLPEMFRFYADILKFEVIWGNEHSDYASFRNGDGASLSLYGRGAMARALGTKPETSDRAGHDYSVIGFETENLDERAAEFIDRGAKLVAAPCNRPDWGIRTVHLRDPDGNLLEFFSVLPRENWSRDLLAEDETLNHSR